MIKLTLLDGTPVFIPVDKIKIIGNSPLLDGPNTIQVQESAAYVAGMVVLEGAMRKLV